MSRFPFNNFILRASTSIGVLALVFSCMVERKPPIDEVAVVQQDYPDDHAFGVELMYSDSAQLKMTLKAPEVVRFLNSEEPYIEYPQGIYVQFFDALGNVSTTIRADYAHQNETTGIINAKNDVHVINSKGEELMSEHLIWNRETERITSDEFVRIRTEEQYITGYGLDSDQRFEDYTLKKIKGTLSLGDD